MEKYKYIPHTADQYIEAYGKTINELFENAALGLTNMMVKDVEPKDTKKINITADSNEEILYKFLNEILVLRDSENIFLSNFKVKLKSKTLEVEAKGEEFNPEKHEQGMDVKAITYHELKIEKTKEGFKVKILVDI